MDFDDLVEHLTTLRHPSREWAERLAMLINATYERNNSKNRVSVWDFKDGTFSIQQDWVK